MSELNKLLKQFIGSNQVDGSKILLENNEAIRAKKADGSEKLIFKVSSSDKIEMSDDVFVGSEKLATESVADSKVAVEKNRAETAEAGLSSSITSGVAEAKSHAETKASEAESAAKSYADDRDDVVLTEAKSYTDTKIADVMGGIAPATLDTIKEIADALASEQTATGSILSQLSTLSGEISSVSSDVADLDAYAQSIADDLDVLDTYAHSVGSALTQEISDRQAAVTSLQSADSALATRVTNLEARPAGDEYSYYTVLMSENNLAYIDLDRQAKAITSAAIGHLVAREGKDFSKSVVNGVTRITFTNGFAQNGSTPVQPNQEFHVAYAYQA